MSTIDEQARTISDWLIREGRFLVPTAMIESLGWRLRAAGLVVDRMSFSLRVLSANVLALAPMWRPNMPLELRTFDYVDRDAGYYDRSPFRAVRESGEPLALDLDVTPDEMFGIIPELKADGYRAYAVAPISFSDGNFNALTLASRDRDGLKDAIPMLNAIDPALASVLEIFTGKRVLRELLSTYVGRGPANQIISGTTHRGEVTRIRAAILFADLRGFTAMTSALPPEATADILNRYYDLVVPEIAARGGELLKFIGDGILAVFEEDGGTAGDACQRALEAAQTALASVHSGALDDDSIRFGIALHYGDAAYGNVGSGDRLDFTVVGRDVNVAARISALCSALGRPLLASAEFVAQVAPAFQSCGAHQAHGLDELLEVFEPVETVAIAVAV